MKKLAICVALAGLVVLWSSLLDGNASQKSAASEPSDVSSHAEIPDRAQQPRLPDLACGFAGMIQGKVAAKHNGEIVVTVEKVTRVWKTSKAQDPETLLGKKVAVRGSKKDGHYAKLIARFIDGLNVGETVALDVGHKGEGEALTILELTQKQKERRPMLYVREAEGSVDEVAKKLEEAAAANQFGVLGIHDLKKR